MQDPEMPAEVQRGLESSDHQICSRAGSTNRLGGLGLRQISMSDCLLLRRDNNSALLCPWGEGKVMTGASEDSICGSGLAQEVLHHVEQSQSAVVSFKSKCSACLLAHHP